ncbi:MAG: AIR synthase-related protein, partial [Planctomycetes bacterium]|nr:AIR synthase-related protein [Planctomycetota bacterium]
QGPRAHGPGDGTVVKPRLDLKQGAAIGCGIAPSMALLDPYAGTACAIDEAIRNVVAAGGNPHRTALLDNFCWGDCRKSDRLGSLVRAAEACHDAALAYGAPFVSGKDSLNNEFRVGEVETPIPPTLLATAIAPVNNTAYCPTTPLKRAGNLLLAVGSTRSDGGGSVAAELLGLEASRVPMPDFAMAPSVFDALHQTIQAGWIEACHDLAEGGLAVAAAEMVLGGELGARIDVTRLPSDSELGSAGRLFSESPTRFLIEVHPDHLKDVLEVFGTLPIASIGEVTAASNGIASLELLEGNTVLASVTHPDLLRWNRAL